MVEQNHIGIVTQQKHIWWNLRVSVGEVTEGPLQRTSDKQYQWTLITHAVYQSLSVCMCVRVKKPLSEKLSLHSLDTQNGSTSSFSSSELMPQWLHPPLCSTPPFGADISTHHWSRRQTNGNPPARWNYWWLSFVSPLPTTTIPYLLPPFCPFSCASVCFSHPQTTSLPFQLRGGWGFTLFLLTPFYFFFPNTPLTFCYFKSFTSIGAQRVVRRVQK